ncbi:GNAT family N-acetyltransferase, partial [Planktotalea sp.]|uniref:GNAT family N-acetyltransferase n=1 Tax=Planktotalea sp. TaxID=2029877 RepID=UPI003C71A1C8
SDIKLCTLQSSDHDWVVSQHQALYARDEGFDASFGPLVDEILTTFETRLDPSSDAGWIACEGDMRLGCIFCVRQDAQTAKLRMFLLMPEARGKGIGRQLLEQCMGFAISKGYVRMALWTHESHKAACALYEQAGWHCVSSKPVVSFGVSLIEQQWEITL